MVDTDALLRGFVLHFQNQGYAPGTVAEAAGLLQPGSAVLTRSDGYSLQILCLVQRLTWPAAPFALAPAELHAIGTACRRHLNGKQPVVLRIVEICRQAAPAEDKARLAALRQGLPRHVQVEVAQVDVQGGTAWADAGWLRRRALRRELLGVLANPPQALEQKAALPTRLGRPALTTALIAVLAAIFLAELGFALGPLSGMLSPNPLTLVALGGIFGPAFAEAQEYWRLFTAPLLHGGALHIGFNGLALWIAGQALEGLLGRAWFFALFAASAVTGAVFSLWLNPANLVSVGASGGIMGLLAAMLVVAQRLPYGPARTQYRGTALQMLIPALLPLGISIGGAAIDYGAHLGGALAGAGLMGLLLVLWRRDDAVTPLRPFALLVGAVFIAGACWGAVEVVSGYAEYAAIRR